jgi:head-tail adaptor
MRLEHLAAVEQSTPANNETIYDWPTVTKTYSAALDSFGVNEVVAQGQNHSTRAMRVRIRGRDLGISPNDHMRDKVTGVEYRITGGPVQSDDGMETIIDLAMVIPTEATR